MLAKTGTNYNPPDDVEPEALGPINMRMAWLGAAFTVARAMARPPFELVLFETFDETLSKIITLGADGRLVPDSSRCKMTRGKARRWIG